MTEIVASLGRLPSSTYVRSVPIAVVAALAIGIPSDLVPNPIFGRPVPVRPIDVVIWAITSALIGLILAIRPGRTDDADGVEGVDVDDPAETRAVWGGIVSFLAVGCPVCNQAVVALIGTSGALSWWAPVQPFVGALAIGLLLVALRTRLRTYDLEACPIG